MNINPIKAIHRFNKEAGLLELGYDDVRECAYPIEEMLEGFDLEALSVELGSKCVATPKEISRELVNLANAKADAPTVSDVDRFDKHLDAIVFCFGSLFKLGLSPQQAMQGLSVVMEANMQKLNAGQDSEGKQMKPDNFVSPEAKLQKILDKRTS